MVNPLHFPTAFPCLVCDTKHVNNAHRDDPMLTIIKAELFLTCYIAVLAAIRPAAQAAGFVWYDGLIDYPAFMRGETPDNTEWLRKPEFVETLGDICAYWDYDADEDWVCYPDVEILGYVEVDTAALDSMYGYHIIEV